MVGIEVKLLDWLEIDKIYLYMKHLEYKFLHHSKFIIIYQYHK